MTPPRVRRAKRRVQLPHRILEIWIPRNDVNKTQSYVAERQVVGRRETRLLKNRLQSHEPRFIVRCSTWLAVSVSRQSIPGRRLVNVINDQHVDRHILDLLELEPQLLLHGVKDVRPFYGVGRLPGFIQR